MPADSLKDEIRKMNGEKSEQKKTKIEIDILLAEADRCYCRSTDEKEHRKSYGMRFFYEMTYKDEMYKFKEID